MEPSPDPSSSSSRPSSSLPPPLPPLQNPKYRHISRSAAKRESVQLLGSIKDLQLHFSRAGLVEHRPGAGVGVKGLGGITEGDEENQPPSNQSSRPSRERRPWKEVELPRIDPISARREARGLIGNIRNLWHLGLPSSPSVILTSPNSPNRPEASERSDTRTVLINTAQAIRRIRFLALSSAHTSSGRRVSGPTLSAPKPRSRLGFSTPSRPSGGLPRAVNYQTAERKSSLGPEEIREDGLAELRKAALEVLAGLRGLEERLRMENTHEDGIHRDEMTRAPSPGESSTSSALDTQSTAFTEPLSYDSEEEDYNLNALAQNQQSETEHLLTWEERIILEEREYEEIIDGDKVDNVREGVRKWVGVVEKLFGVRERASNSEVEEWARSDQWEGKSAERLHAFLIAHLPTHLQLALPQPGEADFDAQVSTRLSDGYVLAQAFNTALAVSPKAWGFIPEEEIQDTLVLGHDESVTPEGEEIRREKEWTFRRVQNLTCWAAALRLRYNLPIHMPSQSASSSSFLPLPSGLPPRSSSLSLSTSPSLGATSTVNGPLDKAVRKKDNAPRIDFDPLVIAKRAEGWEKMLEGLTSVWVEESAREVRQVAEAEAFEG